MHLLKLIVSFAVILLLAGCQTARELSDRNDKPEEEVLSKEEVHRIDQLFYEAQKQKITGNHERAVEKFARIIAIHPAMHVAHYELAIYYFEIDDVDRAKHHIERAIETDRDGIHWYKILYADILSESGDFKKSAEIYVDLIDAFPNQKSYYDGAIEMYANASMFEKALEIAGLAEERMGYNGSIGFRKYQMYMQLGQQDKAVEEVRKLIELHPGDIRFEELLANTYRNAEKWSEAYETYYSILEKQPHNFQSQIALFHYYKGNDKQAEMIEMTGKIMENPKVELEQKIRVFYEVFLQEGPLNEFIGEALDAAEILTEVHPDQAESHALRGDTYYQFDSLDKAKKHYYKSLEIRQDVYAVWENVFLIHLELQDFEGLQSSTNEAAELFPNQGELFYFNGIANRELKQYSEALKSFKLASSLIFDSEQFKSEIKSQIADVYYQMGQHESAFEYFETSIEIHPENAVALNNYSYYLALQNINLEEARKMSEKSLKLSPENPAYMDTYGWILFKKGKYEEAETWIAKALKKEPESEEIVEHYGDVLFKLGRKEEAIRYWEKAYSLSENNKNLLEKIESKSLND